MTPRIRVMIVADHPIMMDGLRMVFEREADMQVVCEDTSVTQVIRDFALYHPDVTIVDLQFPHGEGLRIVRGLLKLAPASPVVVLTTYPGEAAAAVSEGSAVIFEVSKTASSTEIIAAARVAVASPPP